MPLGCLLPSVCPLAVCYPLCAPWLSVTLCVPLGCLLPSVCPLAVCYPLCVSWLSVTLTVVAKLKLALYMESGCPLDNFSSIIFHENSCCTYMYHHMPYISLASFLGSCGEKDFPNKSLGTRLTYHRPLPGGCVEVAMS